MTDNQLALDFAREIMGWEDVAFFPGDKVLTGFKDNEGLLYPIDNAGVLLAALQEWCDKHSHEFAIRYCLEDKGYFIEMIETFGPLASIQVTVGGKDLSTALMTACLEAERKRKSIE